MLTEITIKRNRSLMLSVNVDVFLPEFERGLARPLHPDTEKLLNWYEEELRKTVTAEQNKLNAILRDKANSLDYAADEICTLLGLYITRRKTI